MVGSSQLGSDDCERAFLCKEKVCIVSVTNSVAPAFSVCRLNVLEGLM